MRVKISGITSLQEAQDAVEAGTDLLGFVFYDKSPRCVSPDEVRAVVTELPPSVTTVGVFVDERPHRVEAILNDCDLDLAQLDGSEPPPEVRMLAPRAYKTLRPQDREGGEATVAMYRDVVPDAEDRPQFLLDAHQPWRIGEERKGASWHAAKVLARRFRILLGGGLSAETVAEAVREVEPWGVELSVEFKAGRELLSPEEMRGFVAAAKG